MPPRTTKKAKPTAAAPAAAAAPTRKEYQAEMLVGARAQRGMINGEPNFVYDGQWRRQRNFVPQKANMPRFGPSSGLNNS